MNIEIVKISTVKSNPNNPRVIKDDKFNKLVQSIKDFPLMLEIRPIVVNDDMIVLGGNMRLKACKEAGLKDVPIIKASDLTEDQQREFIIKDNVGFGEWDWDLLANEWDTEKFDEWGLDLPIDLESIKATKDIPDIGEIEFSEELLLEHNYIVLYFDNAMDWEVAQEIYGLKQVKSKTSAEGTQKIGIGRVINGKNFI
jgi:hypothetical protein